ncbi:MAG: PfkB family carbohydrate kinase [Erysipelotrichaceae bacterium]|nr:PfkB family carbohydrate kinase [Erysipelotrichaceae bacterium]
MQKALIIGSCVCDVIIRVHQYPKISEDENIISQSLQLGGCAYNVAYILQQMHVPFDLFSPVGKGIYGDFVKENLINEDISIMIESNDNNGCCYCIVDDSSERTFLCEHGVEYLYTKDYFKLLDMNKYDCIYICGLEIEEVTGNNIIDFLEANNHQTIYFAPGPRIHLIDEDKMQRIFQLHPIIHLNEQEILTYTHQDDVNQAVVSLYELSQNVIIVTLGKQGCYYYDGYHSYVVSTVSQEIESSVGAGDSHLGGIIACRKKGYDWYDTLTNANKIAVQKLSQ